MATLALTVAPVMAGDLTPPPGPVGPTMKTLSQVEPRTPVSATTTPGDFNSVYQITQSGSYYLTGNVAGVAGKAGVKIGVGNVTLDLNGFTISGGATGISTVDTDSVTVRNGRITNCSGTGVDFQTVDNAFLEDLSVTNCTDKGLQCGTNALVRHCYSRFNGHGFTFYDGTRLEDCTARSNTAIGFYGTGIGNILVRCIASDNTADGFGLVGGSHSILESCIARGNGGGISVNTHCRVSGCTATDNGYDGIYANFDTLIERCEADQNENVGIEVGPRTTIRECLTEGNTNQGIHVFGDLCTVSGNQCRANGAAGYAGVWIQASGCRVENNESNGNGFGIFVSNGATDNIIVRNSCRANGTNFTIPANNELAPIVTNPGSNNFSTATPWSNFAY